MKTRLLIASILLNSCAAQTFSEAMDEAMETHGVMGMSALIICDGEIGEAYYGGLRNYDPMKRRATTLPPFPKASPPWGV